MVIMGNSDALDSGSLPGDTSAVTEAKSQATSSSHMASSANLSSTKDTHNRKHKRDWSECVTFSNPKKINSLQHNIKYLIISSPNQGLNKLSPFFIQKSLQGICGDPKNVKRLRSGDLLIETSSPLQTNSLLPVTNFGNINVTITPHNTLNSSRGVISEFDLVNISETEIQEELSQQGVTQARRITIKKGNDIINTKHVILTFNSPSLPTHIIAGYLKCNVRPYVPNPLRCFKCQRFGHSKTSCRGNETCSRCGVGGHSFTECNLEPKCINCDGQHTANSRSCPKWILEKKIQNIKATQNISYPEARKIANSSQLKPNVSYAAAASKPEMKTIGTQTLISVPSTQNINLKGKIAKLVDRTQKETTNESTSAQTEKPITGITKIANITVTNKTNIKPLKTAKNTKTKGKKYSKETFLKVSKESVPNESLGSDSSECGDMEVEPGMETPAHLLPSTTKFWKKTPPHA